MTATDIAPVSTKEFVGIPSTIECGLTMKHVRDMIRTYSHTMDSSVVSLNLSYVARTKPSSFKTTKSMVPKSLAPFKTSICIKSSVS